MDDDDEEDEEPLTRSPLVDALFDEDDEPALLFEFGDIAADFKADMLGLPDELPLPMVECFGDDVPYGELFGLGKV